jgi:DNA (cytosine-5)-methyltransferase 1
MFRLNGRQANSLIDLFAGAGGLSRGLESAGFQSLYASEYIERYAETYAINHPETLVDTRDIREVDPEQIREALGLNKGELGLLAGGPPCQGFSVNAPVRRVDDRRNHLFRDFLRFVEAFEPSAVLIENVPGLVSFEGGATLDAILRALKELGYEADVRILYAPHFGVPQTRWRTVIIGSRHSSALQVSQVFPDPVHSAPARVNFTASHRNRRLVSDAVLGGLTAHTTIADAIADLPVISSGAAIPDGSAYTRSAGSDYQRLMRAGSTGIYNHRSANLSPINRERLEHIPAGGNWTNIPHELLPAGMQRARRSDHTKRYGRGLADGLASTILTKCDPHWGAYFHYEQDRTYSVREAARIQSFPDSYRFTGTLSEQFAQVGNAVPPLMAQALGTSIAALIDFPTAKVAV